MIKSGKSFDELKQALTAAKPAINPPTKVDFEGMKVRLSADSERYTEVSRQRAFTSEALMRSYNL